MNGVLKRYLSALLVFLMLFSTIGELGISYAAPPDNNPKPYTLNVKTDGHCWLNVYWEYDEKITAGTISKLNMHDYVIETDYGYHVKYVKVDNIIQDDVSWYQFDRSVKEHTIEIVTEKNEKTKPLPDGKYNIAIKDVIVGRNIFSRDSYLQFFDDTAELEVIDGQWYLTFELISDAVGFISNLVDIKYYDKNELDASKQFKAVEIVSEEEDSAGKALSKKIRMPLAPLSSGAYISLEWDRSVEFDPVLYIDLDLEDFDAYQTGTFKYLGDEDKGIDYQADYYYSDYYFWPSARGFNQQLATMSLCFQLSSWSSAEDFSSPENPDYEEKAKNAKSLLNELGFSNIVVNSYYKEKPITDSIGAVIGQKQIVVDGKNYTLIALAVRGGGYGKEWASNFVVGPNGAHAGFDAAKVKILNFLRQYIASNGIQGDIKLWLTGYSRGGAVANLTAAAIDDNPSLVLGGTPSEPNLSNRHLDRKDIYAYTFETPAGTIANNADADTYNNIFNIINLSDPVPKVAPSAWGFRRYGTDKILPYRQYYIENNTYVGKDTTYDAVQDRMKVCYQELQVGDPYLLTEKAIKTPDYLGGVLIQPQHQRDLLDEYIEDMVTKVISADGVSHREKYCSKYQWALFDVSELIFGEEPKKVKIAKAEILNVFSFYFPKLSYEYSRARLVSDKTTVLGNAVELITKALNRAGITQYDKGGIESSLYNICYLLLDVAESNLDAVVYTFMDSKRIVQAHQPYVCLAWLQSMDTNYLADAKPYWISGAAKKVKINCPVDIELYNASNELVAAIIDDVPQQIVGSKMMPYIDQNGEKTFWLAPDADYRMKITATDNGEMDVSILETMPFVSGANRIVNYYDLPLQTGDVYIATIPKYSDDDIKLAFKQTLNGSKTAYTLSQNGAKIEPDLNLSGQDAINSVYTVETMVNDASLGFVFGGGPSQVGRYDRLEAVPTDGSRFTGWYQDGVLLSTEPVYRLRVTKDNKIEARFEPVSYTVRFVDWDDSELSVQTVSHGAIAIAPAAPTRPGYQFTGWNKDFNQVKSDLTVKALYNDGNYRVSFIDWDDTVLKIDTVTHGAVAIAPAAPSRIGYTFTGWDKSFAEVISDLVVRAQYEKDISSIEPPTEGETVENSNTDTDDDDWVIISPAEQMDNTNSQNDSAAANNTVILKDVSQAVADNLARYNRLPLPQAAYYTDGTVKTVTIDLTGLEAKADYRVVLVNKNGQAEVIDGTRRADQLTVTLPEGGILLLYKREVLPASGKLSFKPVTLTDLTGHWSEAVVRDLAARGIVSPRQAGLYQPARAITRAEFISAIISYLSVPQQTATAFKDVTTEHPHRAAIETARAIGLVEGVGGNTFAPDQAISRQDLATIINRLLPIIAVTDDDLRLNRTLELNRFSDHKAVSDYAKAALTRLMQAGMIKGTPDGQLMPQSNTTRAETAQLLYNLIMVLSNE